MRTTKLILAVAVLLASAVGVAQTTNGSSADQSATVPDPQTVPGKPGDLPAQQQPDRSANPQSSTPTANQAANPAVDDATLQQNVKQALSVDTNFAGVQPSVHDGVVELTGTVPTKDARKQAKSIAESVPGVKGVKEHLNVSGSGNSGPNGPNGPGAVSNPNNPGQNTAGSIYGNSKPGNSNTSNNPGATTPPAGSTPPTVPQSSTPPPQAANRTGDGRLVSAALQDQQPSAGTVQGQQSAAPNNAPAANSKDDSSLQSQIESALHNEPSLSQSHITTKVTGNSIDLSGTVASSRALQTAERMARSFDGNRKVNNNLVVVGNGRSAAASNRQTNPPASR